MLRLSISQLFATALATFLVIGCDSGGPENTGPSEDEARVSFQLANTAQSDFPGSPDSVAVRIWDAGGDNTALKIVEFPSDGETREVDVLTTPGDRFVGIMAYRSDGTVSFAAATENAMTFQAGEGTEIDFQNDLITWDFEYSIQGGTFEVGEIIQLRTQEDVSESTADELIERRVSGPGNVQRGTVFYDSEGFESTGSAGFEARIESIPNTDVLRETSLSENENPIVIENGDLLESMFLRVRLPVEQRWMPETDRGPQFVTRPHPDSSALDVEEIASDITVVFSK